MALHDPSRINIALVGVGNCASSLVQGIAYYQNGGSNEQIGLMHWDLGGYRPKDLQVVAAWDVDSRKVGRDVAEAIFSAPNNTQIFCDHVKPTGAQVMMGKRLDGVAPHMADYPAERSFMLADKPEPSQEEVVRILRETNT